MFTGLVAFGTYFCMYAYRKPFTVATYEGEYLWGVDLKVLFIIAQVVGYTTSKFMGIKVVSESTKGKQALMILVLIAFAEVALLFFGWVPSPYNIIFLFLNGLPLGMIWGLVFSYLEGRRHTEILSAMLSASFIVSSGVVKSVGKHFIIHSQISEYWMPFVTGLVFLPPLFIFLYLLSKVPPPSEKDELHRTKRKPMQRHERQAFFNRFAFGLVALTLAYMAITAFRDFRDNFAAEVWQAVGMGDQAMVFTYSEVPVAIMVLILLGATMMIKNNFSAFVTYHLMIFFGLFLIGISTWLFESQLISPLTWMILVGIGLYASYVTFASVMYDRLIAAFQYSGTAGFMIYVSDAFGYLGSVGILLYKSLGAPDISWLSFFINISYLTVIAGGTLVFFSLVYFAKIPRKVPDQSLVISTN